MENITYRLLNLSSLGFLKYKVEKLYQSKINPRWCIYDVF